MSLDLVRESRIRMIRGFTTYDSGVQKVYVTICIIPENNPWPDKKNKYKITMEKHVNLVYNKDKF